MTPTAFALTLERPPCEPRPKKDTRAPTTAASEPPACGQHDGPSPPGAAQSHLGGLCEVSVTADRRETSRAGRCLRLIEADRPVEVLEPLLAEVSQEDVEIVLLLVLEQGLRRLGDEDLPAVPGRTNPCRAVHRRARCNGRRSRSPAPCGDPSAP